MSRKSSSHPGSSGGHSAGTTTGDGPGIREMILESARIICEDDVLDYRAAKMKAAQRLGLSPRTALPDNARIQAAVI